jgi:hypothetical protein
MSPFQGGYSTSLFDRNRMTRSEQSRLPFPTRLLERIRRDHPNVVLSPSE